MSSLEDKDVLLSNLSQELQEKDSQIEDRLKTLNEQAKFLQILTNDLEQKNSILNMQIKDITKKENIINDINNEKLSLQEEKNQLLLINENYKRTKDFVNCFAKVLDSNASDDILSHSTDINVADNKQLYSEDFYKINAEESFDSAKKIINIFMKYYKPKSVLDIGCGVGTWLKAWKEASATKVLGIDTNDMPENALYIPRKDIKIFDFEVDKVDIEDKFDLAMSLECFEHVTKKHEDNAFNLLINSSDIILFSAAIPFQVGTNHINCHKLAYWVDKFKQNNYKCYDIIRPECLKHSLDVGPWYIQNILVFAKNNKASILESCGANPVENPVMFYHSQILQDILNGNK